MRTVFLCLLALAMAGRAPATETWPTVEFEVYEGYGYPWTDTNAIALARAAGLQRTDVSAPTATPLAPALRDEMQAYLSEVAREYQRMGFPPPALEPIVTRADGKKAYRVYWFAFGDTEQLRARAATPAVMAYACRGEPNLRRLSLNARPEGPKAPKNRLAASTGKLPGQLDRLTDKGYGDLAHELFHAVQRGTRFYGKNCDLPSWLNEGMAEAIGHDMAWKLRGVAFRPPYDQIDRWGLRSYRSTFAYSGHNAQKVGYGTSSFWRYLAELERSLQSKSAPPPRPDAGPLIRTDAFDYGYLARLLDDTTHLRRSRDNRHWIDWLDRWLGADQRLRLGFERAYPDFLTVLADFGRYRAMGGGTGAARREWVQKETLAGCPEYRLDLASPAPMAAARIVLAANGAGCLRVLRTDAGGEPVLVDARTLVPAPLARALHVGISGQTRAMEPVVAKDGAGQAVVSWAFPLEPGAAVDLVFANVQPTPSTSQDVQIDMAFAISGWQWTGPPPPRPGATRRAGKPVGKRKESQPVQQGPGTTRLVRESGEAAAQVCRWPFPDAAVHCGPRMDLVLSRRPRWHAWRENPMAPGEDDLASEGALLAFTASRSADALAALDEMEVRIRMPRLDHGFSGTLDNVLVTVSEGDAPDWVSRGPANAGHAHDPYYAASGRVRIDRYDALELRGWFEADLVEMPPSGRVGPASLPVAASVAGDFVVGRPWEGDDRYEGVVPETEEIISAITDMLPGSLRTDERFTLPPGAENPVPGPNSGSGQGVGVASGCDCSCTGKSELLEYLEAQEDVEQPGLSQLAKAMCMVQCQAAYSACPDD